MALRVVSSLLVGVIIAGLVYVSFKNSLDNAFVFDDHLAITNNHDVKDPSGHNLWTDDIWGKELSAHDSHKSFRPLLIWLFRTLWFISSEARWFRQVSLGAHCFATWLFFHLTQMIWARLDLSFAATVMFAIHPIHVESVAAVVNMAEAFSASFILLSYMLFLRATKHGAISRGGILYWLKEFVVILVWVVLVVLASLFKETGITACLLVVAKTVMDLVIWFISNRLAPPKPTTHHTAYATVGWVYTLYSLTALLLTYLYLAGRDLMTSPHRSGILSDTRSILYHLLLKPVLEKGESYLDSSQLLRRAENPFAQLLGWEKVYSTMYLHFLYMSKLVYPTEQSPEYAFNCIPKVASTHDIRLYQSLAVYGGLVLIGLVGLWWAVHARRENAYTKISAVEAEASVGSDITSDNESSDVDDRVSLVAADPSSAISPSSTPTKAAIQPTSSNTTSTSLSSIPPDALLHSLMLLVVFFLPASGLVFKLGTLLAERLMYTPSIGSCMLVASVLYGAAHTVSWAVNSVLCGIYSMVCGNSPTNPDKQMTKTTSPAPRTWSARSLLTQLLFWPAVISLAYLYAQRTVAYNAVWHDDNTLFLESLKVCPESAKMNLQVSKVYSQRGDFVSARKHLQAAQRIDPDFCDTGYQDVVITMAVAASHGERNSLDVAAEKAVHNLHCIYTNTATITLLNHLWSSQLQSVQATGNKALISKELEKQGDIARKGEVMFLAAQKFIEASSFAFEVNQVDRAVSLATKAEKIVVGLEQKLQNGTSSDEDVELNAEVRCRIFTLSGLFRTSQIQSLATQASKADTKSAKGKKKNSKVDKKKQEEVDNSSAKKSAKLTTRTVSLLRRAVLQDCTEAAVQLPQLTEGSGVMQSSVVVEHLPLAINHLVSLWTLQMNGNSPQQQSNTQAVTVDAATTPQSLESYAQDLTSVFYVASLLRQRTTPTSGAGSGNAKAMELCQVLMKLVTNAYHTAGSRFLHSGDLPGAVQSFQRGLLAHSDAHTTRVVNFKYGHTAQSGRESGSVPVVTLDDFRNVTLTAETCTSLHWLTETIVGTPDFQRNLALVQEVQVYVQKLLKCLSNKLYSSPKLDAKHLRAVLKSLTASISAGVDTTGNAEIEARNE